MILLQLIVTVERLYGSLETIQLRYETIDGSAQSGYDFQGVPSGAVAMSEGEKSVPIFIRVYIYICVCVCMCIFCHFMSIFSPC